MPGQYNVLRVADLNAAVGDTLIVSNPVKNYAINIDGVLSGGSGGAPILIRPNADGGNNYNGQGGSFHNGGFSSFGNIQNGIVGGQANEGHYIQSEIRLSKQGNYWIANIVSSQWPAAGSAPAAFVYTSIWLGGAAALQAIAVEVEDAIALRRFTGRISYYGVDG